MIGLSSNKEMEAEKTAPSGNQNKEDMQEEMDEELALNLYRNTMTGNWESIVEMYKQHTFAAISARINSSRDTALHVAVSIAPENIVIELIRVISHISELVLLIKNDEGNTPLHLAASTGRLKICILLATLHYNKSDFFQGSKPLKKVLKNLEKSYFKSSINP